jgi:hypothetical protein
MATVLAYATVVFLSRALLSTLILPPWQQPDEPIHVAVAEVWRSRISGDDAHDRGRQAEIIDSMIRHGWWRHYQQPLPPGPQPTRFASTGAVFRTIGLEPEDWVYQPPYYATVGSLLSLAPRAPVERDLYVMRIVSIVFAAGTLWVAYLGSRLALDGLGAATVTSLLAVHPQFAIVSTTAGPDAVVNFAGAVLWWQAMRTLHTAQWVRALLILWLAALAAAMVDRVGIALIPIAFIVTVVVSFQRLRFRAAAVVVALAVLAIALVIETIPAIRRLLKITLADPLVPWSFAGALEYTRRFSVFLFTSWWYALGWARYFAPLWWLIGATVITAVAVVGTWRSFVRSNATRIVIVVAGVNLLCLLLAISWVFLRVRVGAQGRYLFPAIVPTLTLMWLGTAAWVPARLRPAVSTALVAAVAILDLVAWTVVAVPAYL